MRFHVAGRTVPQLSSIIKQLRRTIGNKRIKSSWREAWSTWKHNGTVLSSVKRYCVREKIATACCVYGANFLLSHLAAYSAIKKRNRDKHRQLSDWKQAAAATGIKISQTNEDWLPTLWSPKRPIPFSWIVKEMPSILHPLWPTAIKQENKRVIKVFFCVFAVFVLAPIQFWLKFIDPLSDIYRSFCSWLHVRVFWGKKSFSWPKFSVGCNNFYKTLLSRIIRHSFKLVWNNEPLLMLPVFFGVFSTLLFSTAPSTLLSWFNLFFKAFSKLTVHAR